MVLRRRTVVLIVLLVGIGLVSLPHHRQTKWTFSKAERASAETKTPPSAPPTPAQLRATFAAIKLPKGFHRTSSCWLPGKEVMCVVRFPSIPLNRARDQILIAEAGVKPTAQSREYATSCNSGKHRALRGSRNLHWLTCLGTEALIGKALVSVSVHSLVQSVHGRLLSTTRTFRDSEGTTLRGTEIDFMDFGVPHESPQG